VVLEELDGEALVYDPTCGAVHRFNGIVLFVWTVCDGTRNTAQIIDLVTNSYSTEWNEAEEHVKRVLAEFHSLGLLQLGTTPPSDISNSSIHYSGPDAKHHPPAYTISRRRVLSGGVGMIVIAPPVISTFFASGSSAAASNPINPGYSPTGPGGCANPGYSCITALDCCNTLQSNCQAGKCCIQVNQTGCFVDSDCCSGLTCYAGTCEL
jgi:hypothetical protein